MARRAPRPPAKLVSPCSGKPNASGSGASMSTSPSNRADASELTRTPPAASCRNRACSMASPNEPMDAAASSAAKMALCATGAARCERPQK
eukprot:5730452-Prymnesium_polylepis.2